MVWIQASGATSTHQCLRSIFQRSTDVCTNVEGDDEERNFSQKEKGRRGGKVSKSIKLQEPRKKNQGKEGEIEEQSKIK